MAFGPELKLDLRPENRLDLINVKSQIEERFGNPFAQFRQVLYYSYHTTAGYLDQKLCARLNHDSESLQDFVRSFQRLFPPNANYRHDQMDLRDELTEDEKRFEPKNADAHLTFIGSGLNNLVTYQNDPDVPVYFIDLDGTNGAIRRLRQTSVFGFDEERLVSNLRVQVPVSTHPIDSVNLKDPNVGLFDRLQQEVQERGIGRGRIDLTLESREMHTGLTMNEFETLLMQHDLVEVLHNPLRFMAERGRHLIRDPRSFKTRMKGYAKYDLPQILNEFLDTMGLSESLVERVIHKFMAYPASRFLRMKRSISLLVSDDPATGEVKIVQGKYQSPILVQWGRSAQQSRRLKASLISFE
ncbi:MAG: YjbQ family protein [Acidobacteriota bacterium]|nr:MAG: YjbQ family protein [Acidobacteriota bacterium]